MTYDVAIVGAGPSGSSTAYELARQGWKVVLLEKEKLPRHKPCGGGLAPAAAQWIGLDLTPVIDRRVSRFRCTFIGENIVETELKDAEIWMVRRERFDFYLAESASKVGAELCDEAPVRSLDWDNKAWRLRSDRGDWRAKYVVAADGAKGQTAKLLGFGVPKRQIAGAIEAEIPWNESDDTVHLEFGLCGGGYAWSFPKSEFASTGVGAFKGHAPKNMREILNGYVGLLGMGMESARVCGHPVCVWDGKQRLHDRNCLLVGEAASVVDPFSAEGIRPALCSGYLAAKALAGALNGNSKALARYSERFHEEIGKDMVWAKRVAAMFYAFPRQGYESAIRTKKAFEWIGEIVSGRARYRDIAGKTLRTFRSKMGLG